MKTAAALALAVAACSVTGLARAGEAGPSTARAQRVCLDASHIMNTVVVSDQAILFYMDNGQVWTNTLRHACPGLKFENAFSEEIRGGEICSNAQMIHVLRQGTPCFLGEFTPYVKPEAGAPK
jgi:hypothetical protein